MMTDQHSSEREEPEFVYGGKLFCIGEDRWVEFDTGREYEITLAHVCHKTQVLVTCYENDRGTALARASAELYQLVLNHQSRCADCQADIVSGLLRRRFPQDAPETEGE